MCISSHSPWWCSGFFYRLTAHFVVQVGQGELRKQWTWEPQMAESLILSLLDPNDVRMSKLIVNTEVILTMYLLSLSLSLSHALCVHTSHCPTVNSWL